MGVKKVVLLLDEDQYEELVKRKGKKNWVDFVMEYVEVDKIMKSTDKTKDK